VEDAHLMSWIPRVVVSVGLASLAVSQERPPDQAFQTVHLSVARQPDAEKKLSAALDDLNNAIIKGGCPPCIYHLWKTYGQQSGPFDFLWVASWPDRATYENIHATPLYNAAWNKHPELGAIRSGEIYNRYVEVKPGK